MNISDDETMRPKYDFSGGVRGKYGARLSKDLNVVVLDREVAAVFPDLASVNEALRALGDNIPPGWLGRKHLVMGFIALLKPRCLMATASCFRAC